MAGTALLELARWLGPWAGERVPPAIRRDRVRIVGAHGRVFEASIYEGRARPRGAYFVAPGLHFLGPDDPRFDRFCRVLAASGFLVLAPFIPSFQSLVLDETAFVDARAAFSLLADRARTREIGRPAVFSISFGSALAFDLATHPDTRDQVAAMTIFGGFCDFISTVRFAVTGATERGGASISVSHDPLNAPVVYLNVLAHLEVDGDKRLLANAWLRMIRRTWNRPELKAPGARDPFAHELALRLPKELRAPFLRGCGLEGGALPWLEAGLEKVAVSHAFMDSSDRLGEVRSRVALVHGRDDDVVPFVETEKLAERLPPRALAGQYITGLYGHTGAERVTASAIVHELVMLAGMLRALANAPSGDL